ncbi:MAG: large-conductance mechanosensitive channel protein MscL, partial [Candidatus Nanosynbacter sp.]|nr:large-conductance mechanosensitive channel protein MscL [Candidatus Nanosynbacter sp.]
TEFKEFINRGSVLDLAVGVIIGGAFQKIISSLVSDIIMPLVGLIAGGVDFRNLEITIPNLFGQDSAAHIRYGNFLQNMVDFLIIAFCVFLIIKIMNKFIGKFKKEQEEKAELTTDEQILEVLKDIRKHQK